jgi:GT2 family glycosyltransferase
LQVDHEVSGVTGACVGIRRQTYLEVGGLTEGLAGSFNDVDLGYKVRRTGRRILLMAQCVLHHFESSTRDGAVADEDIAFMRRRWGRPQRDDYMPVYPKMPASARPRPVQLPRHRSSGIARPPRGR